MFCQHWHQCKALTKAISRTHPSLHLFHPNVESFCINTSTSRMLHSNEVLLDLDEEEKEFALSHHSEKTSTCILFPQDKPQHHNMDRKRKELEDMQWLSCCDRNGIQGISQGDDCYYLLVAFKYSTKNITKLNQYSPKKKKVKPIYHG